VSFIVNHRGEEVDPKQPRIVGLQIDETDLHFHKINYKKDLIIPLQKEIIFGNPGLVTKVEYFEDETKEIPVLNILRAYDIQNPIGKILRKQTQREYYCEDGTIHPEVKNPEGNWYVYTPEESRSATHRRRVNVTNSLETEMLSLLEQLGGGDPEATAENIAKGAAFMTEIAPAINIFHLSGTTKALFDFLDLKDTQDRYQFLIKDIPGAGIKAKDLIKLRLTY